MTKVGDRLRRVGMPAVVVRIAKDRGDVWQVEPVSEMAALGMKMGAAMSGGNADPCLAKDDPNWEPVP